MAFGDYIGQNSFLAGYNNNNSNHINLQEQYLQGVYQQQQAYGVYQQQQVDYVNLQRQVMVMQALPLSIQIKNNDSNAKSSPKVLDFSNKAWLDQRISEVSFSL